MSKLCLYIRVFFWREKSLWRGYFESVGWQSSRTPKIFSFCCLSAVNVHSFMYQLDFPSLSFFFSFQFFCLLFSSSAQCYREKILFEKEELLSLPLFSFSFFFFSLQYNTLIQKNYFHVASIGFSFFFFLLLIDAFLHIFFNSFIYLFIWLFLHGVCL